MAHSQRYESILGILEMLEFSNPTQIEQACEKLEPYFFESKDTAADLETLTFKKDQGQTALVASSKFSNLKFKLKDLLLETLQSAVKIKASMQDWLALTLVVLEFLQKVCALMEYQLSKNEALVLLEMYILENEGLAITVDQLFSNLKGDLTDTQILHSLDLLEKLSTIQYGSDQIHLVESILFVQE